MPVVVARRYRATRPMPKRRTLPDRLMVAVPWAYRLTMRSLEALRLPVDGRVRQILISQAIRSGWGAFNRRDLKLMLVRYTPDCEIVPSPRLQTLGVSGSLRGRGAVQRYINSIEEAWQGWQYSPLAFIDLGERLLTFGFQSAQGSASRAPLRDEFAQIVELDRGLVSHEQVFDEWDAALQAAGLQRSRVWGLDELLAIHRQSRPAA